MSAKGTIQQKWHHMLVQAALWCHVRPLCCHWSLLVKDNHMSLPHHSWCVLFRRILQCTPTPSVLVLMVQSCGGRFPCKVTNVVGTNSWRMCSVENKALYRNLGRHTCVNGSENTWIQRFRGVAHYFWQCSVFKSIKPFFRLVWDIRWYLLCGKIDVDMKTVRSGLYCSNA